MGRFRMVIFAALVAGLIVGNVAPALAKSVTGVIKRYAGNNFDVQPSGGPHLTFVVTPATHLKGALGVGKQVSVTWDPAHTKNGGFLADNVVVNPPPAGGSPTVSGKITRWASTGGNFDVQPNGRPHVTLVNTPSTKIQGHPKVGSNVQVWYTPGPKNLVTRLVVQ